MPMKNARLTFCVLLTNPLLFPLTAKPSMDETIRSPNVIVIMADDLGAEGLNCYDSTLYTTPRFGYWPVMIITRVGVQRGVE